MSLAASVLAGDPLALARLLTQVENSSPAGRAALDELFPHAGKAHLIGVTGATGTGKSSLVNQLTLKFRKPPVGAPRRVAIVAVDPSSPFTGGAVLGDRVRMRDLAGDRGVFIRSMASRGSLGGLAQATAAVVQVFDAAGFDLILIETVGAGQSEVDIARLAHTTLVVEAPGLGDDIQAIKAGILEIADILVVNKADHPGVEKTEHALKTMLGLAHPVEKVFLHHGQTATTPGPEAGATIWVPPIRRTIATDGTGVAELVAAIDQHANHLHQSGDWLKRERARLEVELETLISETLISRFRAGVSDERFAEALDRLVQRTLSPWQAAEALLDGKF
jgi:LAO/AO transport system kinase